MAHTVTSSIERAHIVRGRARQSTTCTCELWLLSTLELWLPSTLKLCLLWNRLLARLLWRHACVNRSAWVCTTGVWAVARRAIWILRFLLLRRLCAAWWGEVLLLLRVVRRRRVLGLLSSRRGRIVLMLRLLRRRRNRWWWVGLAARRREVLLLTLWWMVWQALVAKLEAHNELSGVGVPYPPFSGGAARNQLTPHIVPPRDSRG